MINFLETMAFIFLSTLIRSYIPNNQIVLVLFCVFVYIVIFRDYNNPDKKCQCV